MGVTRVAVPNSRDAMKRKASQFPAVPIPHAGASYNPDLGQYLNHLSAANKVEESKLKVEQKLVRELDAKFPDQEEAKKLESNWLLEMSGGLAEKEMDDDEEDENDEAQGQEQKKERRKTKKQRRKAKEQRTIQQKLAKRKTAKQRSHEFDKLRVIGQEISAREQELAEKLLKKELVQKKREKAGITHRLG